MFLKPKGFILQANKPEVQLAYNSKDNVAVLTTKDGGFDLEDYGKVKFIITFLVFNHYSRTE